MQEYLSKVMLSYGANEDAVRAATGSLLALVKRRATEEQFRELHHQVRQLTRLLKVAAPPVDDPVRQPEVAGAIKVLEDDGLSAMRVANTLRMFGDYLRERAPDAAALLDDCDDLKRTS